MTKRDLGAVALVAAAFFGLFVMFEVVAAAVVLDIDAAEFFRQILRGAFL